MELPSETRIKIIFEDNNAATRMLKYKRATDAMKKLKGSENGNLLDALFIERMRDKQDK